MIDLNDHYTITNPGNYFVQFKAEGLAIVEPFPEEESGPFDPGSFFDDKDARLLGMEGFLAATNRLPSDIIKIEAATGGKR